MRESKKAVFERVAKGVYTVTRKNENEEEVT